MTDSDDDLLEAARTGDRRALEELIERHQARVYRFGILMCRDPEDAQDVLQETLLAMARGIREFRGASSVSTWLYTIARSFCIRKRRRRSGAPDEEQSLDGSAAAEAGGVADPSAGPDEVAAGTEIGKALEAAIRALEPGYREVLLLRDVEGLTAPETGGVLGISHDAVKSRLHRARASVRDRIAPLLGIPDAGTAAGKGCPDVVALFSRHLEDEISADVCAEMERHLAACGRCRGACDSLRRTLALCRTSRIPAQVPPNVQSAVKVALRNFLSDPA